MLPGWISKAFPGKSLVMEKRRRWQVGREEGRRGVGGRRKGREVGGRRKGRVEGERERGRREGRRMALPSSPLWARAWVLAGLWRKLWTGAIMHHYMMQYAS